MSGTGAAILGTAAAVGVFIAALVQGAEEADKLNSAIIATGNYAGVTSGQVRVMASALTQAGTSTMQATAMLSKIIATGKVTGDALQDVAQASLDLARITGESADKTSAIFIKMQDEPVKAVKELDDQLHFLTLTQYENIKALQDQGDTELAAAIAQTAASQAVHERALEVDQNVGLMARAWSNLESNAKSAWAAMAHVGVQDSNSTDLANINSQLDAYRARVNAIRQRTGQPQAVTDDDLAKAGEVALSHDTIMDLIQKKSIASAGARFESWVAQTDSAAAKTNDILKKDSDRWDSILKSAKSDQSKAREIAELRAMTQRDIAANPNNSDEYLKNEQIGLAAIDKKYRAKSGTKGKADPEVSAFSTFQGQVNTLQNAVVGPTDDAALAKYETGIAKLSDELNKYMEKSGDATKGAQLFNEG
jgi:phage-related minor tail protein